jgi:thiosulfate/3-mercaptopyruvate sulfurtransferase
MKKIRPLISTRSLLNLIQNNKDEIKILDCSYPIDQFYENFKKERIPNAKFFNLDLFREENSELPNINPRTKKTKEVFKKYNIFPNDKIVCYDQKGVFSSAKAWFLLKSYSFSDVQVLDGGMVKWKEENLPLETKQLPTEFEPFKSDKDLKYIVFNKNMHINYNKIIENEEKKTFQVIDTRLEKDYKAGTLLNAINIPYEEFTNPDKTLKKKEDLEKLFKDKNIDLERPIITSCRTGMSASLGYFILSQILEKPDIKLYHGSYLEYAKMKNKV